MGREYFTGLRGVNSENSARLRLDRDERKAHRWALTCRSPCRGRRDVQDHVASAAGLRFSTNSSTLPSGFISVKLVSRCTALMLSEAQRRRIGDGERSPADGAADCYTRHLPRAEARRYVESWTEPAGPPRCSAGLGVRGVACLNVGRPDVYETGACAI